MGIFSRKMTEKMSETCECDEEYDTEFISDCEECEKEAKNFQQENSVSTAPQKRTFGLVILIILVFCGVIAIFTVLAIMILERGKNC
jgi:hypothetical protein